MAGHTNSNHFTQICNEMLNLNKSIRFVGVVNNMSKLLVTLYREELVQLLTREETENYTMQAVLRAATREDFANKLGKLKHSMGT
jgi:hypothetical protein